MNQDALAHRIRKLELEMRQMRGMLARMGPTFNPRKHEAILREVFRRRLTAPDLHRKIGGVLDGLPKEEESCNEAR